MNYYIRLDDACEQRDINKWDRIESLLDSFGVCPLVGIIPHCEDKEMDKYSVDSKFWERVKSWEKKDWTIALHGYNHVSLTNHGGINPVNQYSEFAGVELEIQKEKIEKGIKLLKTHRISPKVFFAPFHTFDENTILALKTCSEIRIISDTISNRPYRRNGMTFVPQQAGYVRRLPFNTVTFCYHPNAMNEGDFYKLKSFLEKYKAYFKPFLCEEVKHKYGIVDAVLKFLYFAQR